MENAIIVPFDLNTARKIKSGEIEGSVLIDNIEIEDPVPRAARASRGTWTSPLVARTTVTSTTVAGFGR